MSLTSRQKAILELIKNTQVHPSAEWVFDHVRRQFPNISLGTVYRNLGILRDEGLLNSVAGARGREHWDARLDPHNHLICMNCHGIFDLHKGEEPNLAKIQIENDCQIDHYQLVFYGLCKQCRK